MSDFDMVSAMQKLLLEAEPPQDYLMVFPGDKAVRLLKEQDAMEERIRELEAHLDALRSSVKALPLEECVETSGDGSPELIGYVMQAAGEWDAVIKAMEPPR